MNFLRLSIGYRPLIWGPIAARIARMDDSWNAFESPIERSVQSELGDPSPHWRNEEQRETGCCY